MSRPRKLASIGAITVIAIASSLALYPPNHSYTPDTLVRSVIAEAVVPAFPDNARPDIEWENGARRLWQNHPAEVRFYGMEDREAQNRVLKSVRKHLVESDLPNIGVRFFPKGRTSKHPVREIRYVLVQQ